jgi:hypothetical protein
VPDCCKEMVEVKVQGGKIRRLPAKRPSAAGTTIWDFQWEHGNLSMSNACLSTCHLHECSSPATGPLICLQGSGAGLE